jgi:hypothetical protein
MFGEFNNNDLELDAIYLGMLTARRVKPLSRLEYPVSSCVMDVIKRMGLVVKPVKRLAQNGALVTHWIMGKNHSLIEQYLSDFDGKLLEEGTVQTIRLEARYFGYPVCCAEAYIKSPYTTNDLTPEDRQLLFHYACPGCEETPKLIPPYQLALDEAGNLYKNLQRNSKFSASHGGRVRYQGFRR